MYLFSHHVFPKRVSTCSLKMFSIVVRSKDVGNTGIESYFASSAATTLMIENIETPHDVKNSFVSTFAVPGSLLINKEIGLKESYVIFDCNEFAVLAWPAKLELVSGQKLVRFDLSSSLSQTWVNGSASRYTLYLQHSLKQPRSATSPVVSTKSLWPHARDV